MLANLLSQEEFGLVGAVLIFQAIASIVVDSGFSYALLQRKRPTRLDYSTILWFNLAASAALYIVLYMCAPLIALCFQNDQRLIPLTRVMCLGIILNASAIIQTNRLMKHMNVRMLTISNSIGVAVGGVVGIALAVAGYGAWAIVWQALVNSALKSIILWTTSRWRPLLRFSFPALKSYFGLGSRMMASSFIGTALQYIYSFVIGNRVGFKPLGYYTQSDKWSKMCITSISGAITSSFIPALAAVQDEPQRFAAMVSKMNRFTSYIIFPVMLGLMFMAKPIFHALFATKWDPSIILFQLLLLKGIFYIFSILYNNYLIALGHGGTIVKLGIVRDGSTVAALVATIPFLNLTTPLNPVYGLEIMLWGQVAASALTWLITLVSTVRISRVPVMMFLTDMLPYFAQTAVIIPLMGVAGAPFENPWLKILLMGATGLCLYIGGNFFFKSKIQKEVFMYFRKGKLD